MIAALVIAAVLSVGSSAIWLWTLRQLDLKIYAGAIDQWVAGGSLYDFARADAVQGSLGFTYPPFAGLVLSPIALVPLDVVRPVAAAFTFVVGFACVAILVASITGRVRARVGDLVIVVLITAGAFALIPWGQTAGLGQINLMLMFLLLVDTLILEPRRSALTGIAAGIAAAVKLTPGIFVLYFAVMGRWRAALTALASAAIVTLLAAAVAPEESVRYFTQLMWDGARVGHADHYQNQSISGVLARLVPTTPSLVWAVSALAVVAFALVRARRAFMSGARVSAVTLVGIAGLLASPMSWMHHAVWVIPALMLFGAELTSRRSLRTRRVGTAAVMFVLGVAIWLTYSTRFWGIPVIGYDAASIFDRFASIAPAVWLLAALLLLPTTRPRVVAASPRRG